MKKLLFVVFLVPVLVIGNIYSQQFSIVRTSPSPIYTTIGGSNDITSYFRITNNNPTSSITLRLIRINVNVPPLWETAICDIHNCYSPLVDTTPFVVYSPGVHDSCSAHFYGDSVSGTGSFTIKVEMQGNSETHSETFGAVVWPLGIKPISSTIGEFKLNQNYPNPFNPSTKIVFSIPKSDLVDLRVFDILGREIAVLASGYVNAGEYEVEWDARNLASGMYYYRLKTPDNVAVKKMTLVK